MNFIEYLFSYKTNIMIMRHQDEMIETLKDEVEYEKYKRFKAQNGLRQIQRLLSEYEKGGSFYAPIYRQIKEITDRNVEKKLSDEIFSHYTSNNSK